MTARTLPKTTPISAQLCNMLLSCGLRMAGFDIKAMQVTQVQPLANGGMVVVLEPALTMTKELKDWTDEQLSAELDRLREAVNPISQVDYDLCHNIYAEIELRKRARSETP